MTHIVKNLTVPNASECQLGLLVSDRVELQHVRQIKGAFGHRPVAPNATKSVSINNSTNVDVDNENKVIIVSVDFDLAAKIAEDKEPAVTVSATFLLMYKVNNVDGLGEDHFKSFGETNGVFNAWPYWREYVQTATVRMGLPVLTIPVFRIFKPQEEQGNSTEIDDQKQFHPPESVVREESK